ncbi:16S rRNA (uracil(1498)-N(3))-methyltransferase [Roseovarius sp. SCSIO 43702]|uniref:16S rRNA (uracil(1498)-N(3))-methyltransferase n=1 Tax=Roseovarius sp. SCSIO 43702 TaxID=2823043 RepID=UPI001C72F1EE|nr:16S rRNA (uracil(1498)-N(3))-methyltransferase [Roseovarius sp. SCSIO 43702]QYX57062.1 16S rRNA (uracil(1498)-N(3))-methyltransferase [Roseovarius sp. SCSIO 43702]
MSAAKIRLYVDHPLGAGQTVLLDRDQANYLFNVMRLGEGDRVALFNGREGEWRATVREAGKKRGTLDVDEQTAPLREPPDISLLFAPIKKTRTDFIVEKAAELGAARILPVQTEFTNAERIRRERLQAHAIEAAEQCGATFVPEVAPLERLDRLLETWPDDRHLMFCDEGLAGSPAGLPRELRGAPWAILIGPEGGFSETERARLHSMRNAHPVSLGPRILRADTAAVAALTLWQRELGDWTDA